ncbi:MAG: hypothetical protein IRZ18_08400 [Clostridia bacterium]|nr:hypothetical protein [Clostridia bacterium]
MRDAMMEPAQYLYHFPSTDKVSLARYARAYYRRRMVLMLLELAAQLGYDVVRGTGRPHRAGERRSRVEVLARVRIGRYMYALVPRGSPGALDPEEVRAGARRRRTPSTKAWTADEIRGMADHAIFGNTSGT